MKKDIEQKIELLRSVMLQNGLSAYIILKSDPHFSEYVSPHYAAIEWLTGFTGSAGSVVVTLSATVLFTDSRYHIQAEREIAGKPIALIKSGLFGVPDMEDFILSEIPTSGRVGICGDYVSVSGFERLKSRLGSLRCEIMPDIFDAIWTDRPPMSSGEVSLIPDYIAGEPRSSKLSRLRERVSLQGSDIYIVSVLDDAAWLLNIRGCDIEYNPVVECYVTVESEGTTLYIDAAKLNDTILDALSADGVKTRSYADFAKECCKMKGRRVIYNPERFSALLHSKLNRYGAILNRDCDHGSITVMKAVKNETEIDGFREAMIVDGIALVRFYMWLEEAVSNGERVTESAAAKMLSEFRAMDKFYRGDSFASIVGFGSNGAIVHYNPESGSDTDAVIDRNNLLLIDSGGHYEFGTTDITRTIHLGSPSQQQCEDFTRVLAGHIDLATIQFPRGTRGTQLDILARRNLWNASMNYLHGTGHGVGHYLNVHEGPQGISTREVNVALVPGMVLTNEPGVYREGQWGIRTENIMLCKEASTSEFGDFLAFETLTLFPIDMKLVERSILSASQRKWLEVYHAQVFEKLSGRLSAKEKLWLQSKINKS